MKYMQGVDRSQISLFPVSLDAAIDQDNEVRLIDLFVEGLDLNKFGFATNQVENGRPAYHPKDLLKLFIYGYMNRIRTSRRLEKETKRNIELIWLLPGLSPDHNTINNFRKENPKAIKKVFRQTVEIARNYDFIGGLLLAGDSTRMRAQNSKKNNYNQAKIDRHLTHIEEKLSEYTSLLAQADEEEKVELDRKISEKKQRKQGYEQLEKQLKESGQRQLSTSDPETRMIMVRGPISEVCYNIQSSVDAKHKIPIDYQVTNENDTGAMGNMVRRAKTILKKNDFTVLFDKGYHKGEELDKVHSMDIKTYVSIPGIPKTSQAPHSDYNSEHFQYDHTTDTYTCPAGQTLTASRRWYQYKRPRYRFKQYKTSSCDACAVRAQCTKSKNGKIIHRSEYQPAVDRNKAFLTGNPQLYKERAAIVEHPFGTMKRQWGFDYILTKKTMLNASADVGFMFIAYNLRRIFNLVNNEKLKKLFTLIKAYLYLKTLELTLYRNITRFIPLFGLSINFHRPTLLLIHAPRHLTNSLTLT